MQSNSNHQNAILDRLSARELHFISADLRTILLPKGTTLFEADQAGEIIYFPKGCVISVIGDTGEGGSIEVWAAGSEGMVGIAAIVGKKKPFRGVVQVAGHAAVGKASAMRRHFQKRPAFQHAVLSYYYDLLVQISYLGICNNRHPIEQRFSRWLLMLQDKAGTSELQFTQDAIAGILGTRRATISVAAAHLQAAGLISYRPGAITIRSRRGLLRAACRCYSAITSSLK